MGKVKRKRQQLHTKAVNPAEAPDEEKQQKSKGPVQAGQSVFPSSGIFRKVDIDLEMLSKTLHADSDHMDARSGITSRSLRGTNLKKKEKQKLKHDFWVKKMDVIQRDKKEAKKRKQREKTAIVGDMGVLGDSLPTLELLMKHSGPAKPKQSEGKPKAIQKSKKKKKQMMADIAVFQQVLQHPVFKENPGATISEHLHNKLKQEEEMET